VRRSRSFKDCRATGRNIYIYIKNIVLYGSEVWHVNMKRIKLLFVEVDFLETIEKNITEKQIPVSCKQETSWTVSGPVPQRHTVVSPIAATNSINRRMDTTAYEGFNNLQVPSPNIIRVIKSKE
jgi:hypothetical protein